MYVFASLVNRGLFLKERISFQGFDTPTSDYEPIRLSNASNEFAIKSPAERHTVILIRWLF